MAIDIGNIFKANAKSSWAFLVENGQGCYIPAYQRPYSWDRDNAARLFEDAIHGIEMLLAREDSVTFLGTLITIHDTQYKTVQPIFREEMTQKVMTVIDGQQRITTFIMINIAFHDVIRKLSSKFTGKDERPFKWIFDQAQQSMPDLRDTFVLDMRTGDGNYQFYPRMIRAYDDVWSKRANQARYTSPIARLIWDYHCHVAAGEKSSFSYAPKSNDNKPVKAHAAVSEMFKFLRSKMTQILSNKDKDISFPDIQEIIHNKRFCEAIWGYEIPLEVVEYLRDMQTDKSYESFCELFRALLMTRYMSNRMAFTIVTTHSEDDAFDMFEALNTTGEPLTAYETFKPKVIDAERLANFELSPSKASLDTIERYLERFQKAEQKQRATSEMLVPFASAESGYKLPKRLNDQRRYLRDQYDRLEDMPKKRDFVSRLASMSQLMDRAWDTESVSAIDFTPLAVPDEDVKFAFAALRKLKHHITIAPISRFYDQALSAADDEGHAKGALEFGEAVKATVAFSMLWRGAHGGTENIDSIYRDLLRVGVPELSISPLCARPEKGVGVVSLANYKRALRHYLEKEGLGDRDSWAKRASTVEIYKHSKDVARFLILCACHDSVPDKTVAGLIKRGRPGINRMVDLSILTKDEYFSVEHVAPQSQSQEWHPSITEEPFYVHTLGNLILLPQDINSYLSNREWKQKKAIYALLACEEQEEFDALVGELEKSGFNLSKSADEILRNANHLSMCKSVSTFDSDWDVNLIKARSSRIAELAWDILWPWLASKDADQAAK